MLDLAAQHDLGAARQVAIEALDDLIGGRGDARRDRGPECWRRHRSRAARSVIHHRGTRHRVHLHKVAEHLRALRGDLPAPPSGHRRLVMRYCGDCTAIW